MAQLTPGARGSWEVKDLRGVDFSSSPMEVSPRRASQAVNFINEAGITQKRNGWAQQCRVVKDGVPQRINGIFEYVDGEHKEVLVHAGTRLYRLNKTEAGSIYTMTDVTQSCTYAPAALDLSRLKDTRSQAFLQGGKMYWIGAGDYLVYGSWDGGQSYELRRVYDNEDTYIPKTTINIGSTTMNGIDIRASLDAVNYMTGWRRNGLCGPRKDPNIQAPYGEYYLDTSIDENTVVELEAIGDDGKINVYRTGEKEDDPDAFNDGFNNKNGSRIISRAEGRIRLVGIGATSGTDDNVTVTFRHREEGYENRIESCEFGVLFGVSGNTDRLFLAGNPEFPNVDFYSAMDDYTYFEDINTVSMGSDGYRVLGYSRLADNTMAIFKEKSQTEASIFYRTGYYKDFYNADGSLDEALSIFPTTAGNIGETVISRHACADFGGDSLILSENGVFGIVLTDNVTTATRYTRERSLSINARLRKEPNLSNAVSISYKGRYYLAVNGHCYVADARYRYSAYDALDGAYQYEWWYLDNIPAHVWAEMDGALWFGTEDGRLCCFDDQYTDRIFHDLATGEMTLDEDQECIFYSSAIGFDIRNGDELRVLGGTLHSVYAPSVTVKGGRLFVSPSEIISVYEGAEVYCDRISGAALQLHTKYTVDDVDLGDCSFALLDKSGATVAAGNGTARLCSRHTATLYLSDVDADACSFGLKEHPDAKELDLALYNGEGSGLLTARVTRAQNVKAEWVTSINDLGSAEYTKRLHGMMVVVERGTSGEMRFGYESRFGPSLDQVYGVADAFSWSDFSFIDFTFDAGFARSFNVRLMERGVNFVAMRLTSDTDKPCAINRMAIQYEVTRKTRGVR